MKKLIYKILVSTITIIFIFSLFINQNLGLRVEASSSENFGINQVCTLKLAETSNTASNTSQEENSNQTEQNETTENTTNTTNTVKPLSLEEQKNQVQEQIANANEKLQYVQGEISNKIIEIQQMQDKIDEYQAEYESVQSQYEELQQEVADIEKELKNAELEYNKKDKLLRDKLVVLYKDGSDTYLDILLGSGNIVDFLSNYFMIQTLINYDANSINQVEEQKKEVEKKANELNEKKAKMKFVKNNAEKQAVLLTNTKTILESEKASLDDSEVQITSQIDSYKRQQEEINNLITKSILNSTYGLTYSGGVMLWPTLTSSYITSPFGSRLHPIQGIIKNHDGIDIGGAIGNPVYAAADGVIIYYSWMSGYGNTVMIDHGISSEGKKIVTLYGHGNNYIDGLGVGSEVKKGDLIMAMGSTGNSTGPHVHFEVREDGTAVDPKKYLSADTTTN